MTEINQLPGKFTMSFNDIFTRRNFVQKESCTIGILVIGNEIFSKQLREAIHEYYEKDSNKYKIYFVECAKIEEVLHHTNYLYVDYVVFLLDTRLKFCATDVEYNLQRMHKSFPCGRMCIVNINPHIPESNTNMRLYEIFGLREKYNLPLLNGNVMNPQTCRNLAERLLILIQTSLGIKQKSPFGPWLFR